MSKKASKPPRKHHYVQAAHLRLFVNETGTLNVYGKSGRDFIGIPESIFKKKDLNSYISPKGLETGFEEFVTKLERISFPSLLRISTQGKLSEDDLSLVLGYISLSFIRNPIVQKTVVDQYKHQVIASAKILDNQGKFTNPPESLGKGASLTSLIDDGIIDIGINNSVYLTHFNRMIEHHFRILFGGFKWSLLKSKKNNVVISDHPFTYLTPGAKYGVYGMPMGGKNCEAAFPVSKKLLLNWTMAKVL